MSAENTDGIDSAEKTKKRNRISEPRPLFDAKFAHGVIPYHNYTVPEVAVIFGQSQDRVRTIFRDDRFGDVHRIPSERARNPKRRKYLNPRPYITLLIPYGTLIRFFAETRAVA